MIRRIAGLAAVGALVGVVAVVGVVGVAAAAQGGTYSGKTSQHKGTISLKVSGGKVTKVTFVDGTGVGSGCSQFGAVSPQFPVSFRSHFTINAHGKFTGTGSPRSQELFKLTGTFSGKTVTGSFTDSIPIGQLTGNGFTCSSGKVTFKATLPKS